MSLKSARNFALKLEFLHLLAALTPFTLEKAAKVEAFASTLESEEEYILCALLNLNLAQSVGSSPLGKKAGMGYILAAYESFKLGEMVAVCHTMKTKYPFCPPPPPSLHFPNLDVPTAHRLSPHNENGDSKSATTTSKEHKEREWGADRLDALT